MFSINEKQTVKVSNKRLWCAFFNFDGSFLAVCGENNAITLFSKCMDGIWESQCILSNIHKRSIRNVCWSPCGRYFASASFDGTVVIWKLINGLCEAEALATLEGHTSEVKCVAWSANGHFLATCGRDRSVWFWEFDDEEDVQCLSVLQPHSQDVKSVAWHPKCDILVSTSYDNTINFYKEELDDWVVHVKLNGHKSTVWKAEFSSTGDILASCSDDLSIKLWAPDGPIESSKRWLCVGTLTGHHTDTIFDISWSFDDQYLASCGADNRLCIYKMSSNGLVQRAGKPELDELPVLWCQKFDAHREDLNSVCWYPKLVNQSDWLLATVGDDGLLKFWSFPQQSDHSII